jgi:hypothetical protein
MVTCGLSGSTKCFNIISLKSRFKKNIQIYIWGDPDVDGRIILRGIFRKWEGIVGPGWSGLRIGTGGGHL